MGLPGKTKNAKGGCQPMNSCLLKDIESFALDN